MTRLQQKYKKEVLIALKDRFGYKNILAVPRIEKVTINTGIGKFMQDEKAVEEIIKDLTLIAGQKPVFTRAKKAISGFKIREGLKVGIMVTLRGHRAFDFIERLISLALPRSRDFRGLEQKSVDSYGNLNIGLKEQIIFPEISHENIRNIFGMQITIKTTAKNHEEGLQLFKLMGFPIKN
ncbi:MAG: 50S ribosomal protein L5 [Candidatus Portnoybacteria bacterium RBG_19FT_COMBO_36_7]|uniref:Large ribosomal subunit protein uL5 n=1 Tax=Candidatus Portnoybacteria bacterium RBG_19FT_COMBO_36_7 TaxID=1801992 RepID=A0A1G2F988_9BACT|nr:MAG: 50S ribosomal protein L5 [Candidatus Portnoybacteria bacterium RBG_19FT_COMBO_36_7]